MHWYREERGFTNERSLTDGREFNFDRAARLSIANSNSESEPYTGSRGGADSKPSSEWNNMHDYARGTSEGPDIDSYRYMHNLFCMSQRFLSKYCRD